MKRKTLTRWPAAALLALTAVWGCSQKPKPTPAAEAPAGAPAAVALGETTAVGPFKVALSTHENQVQKGSTTFVADVTRDDQKVTDAKVTLNLAQPDEPGAGPSVPLKWTGDHYEGAADVSASGDWHADVVVDAPGASGTATFVFSINQ